MSSQLQVLVCTYGPEGIERFADTFPPQVRGVEYLVSWQLPDSDVSTPNRLAKRADIKIYKSKERGLSRNRNQAMRLASAPLCLHSDDDVIYTAHSLRSLIQAFVDYPQADILCFRSTNHSNYLKPYPTSMPLSFARAPRGWYPSSFEIAYRRSSVAANIPFNENFGVGAPLFCAGEEDLWLYESRRRGAKVMLMPIDLCAHDHDTTSERHAAKDWFVMTRGAVHSHLHPLSWPLRNLWHSLRQTQMPAIKYFSLCVKGARYARRHKYFAI